MANFLDALLTQGGAPIKPAAGMDSFQGAQLSPVKDAQIFGEAPHHSTGSKILGFLGDFLMSRLHMGTPHHDKIEAERLNAAREADSLDPSHSFNNVSQINPALAEQWSNLARDNDRADTTAATMEQYRQAMIKAQEQALLDKKLGSAASLMGSVLKADPEKRATLYAKNRGVLFNSMMASDPSMRTQFEQLYPETYDEDALTGSINGVIPVAKQIGQSQSQERIDNTEDYRKKTVAQRDRALANQEDRTAIARNRPTGGGTKPLTVRYVGDDGHVHVESSDGRSFDSSGTVRPPSNRRPAPGQTPSNGGAPPVGYKNRYGKVFKGGNPTDPNNWK